MIVPIRYISSGELRCDRNGISESAAIATINSKEYFFPIYGVRDTESKAISWFLSAPRELLQDLAEDEYSSVIEPIRQQLEVRHHSGPLLLVSDVPPLCFVQSKPRSSKPNISIPLRRSPSIVISNTSPLKKRTQIESIFLVLSNAMEFLVLLNLIGSAVVLAFFGQLLLAAMFGATAIGYFLYSKRSSTKRK